MAIECQLDGCVMREWRGCGVSVRWMWPVCALSRMGGGGNADACEKWPARVRKNVQ